MNCVLATEKNCNRLSYEIKIHKKKKTFYSFFYNHFATIFRTVMSFFTTQDTKRLSLVTQAV